MNQKQFLLFKGWLYAAAIAAIIIVVLNVADFSEMDTFGIVAGTIILLVLALFSYSFFRRAKFVSKEEMVLAPIAAAPPKDQITYYKRMLLISSAAFPILSIWIFYDLNSLEAGTVNSVRTWAPIAFLYNLGGYWLAVLAVPILGVVVTVIFISLIRKLKTTKAE